MIETAHPEDPRSATPARAISLTHGIQWQVGQYRIDDAWTPSVNVYRLERRLEICFDLAGVDPSQIELRIEPDRLTLRGQRAAPDPRCSPTEPMRIVTMEIDHGAFCRAIPLEEPIDPTRVAVVSQNGFLWVRLPLRDHA